MVAFTTRDLIRKLVILVKTRFHSINPLSINFTKWSNTRKQFVGNDELFESV